MIICTASHTYAAVTLHDFVYDTTVRQTNNMHFEPMVAVIKATHWHNTL